MLDVTKLPIVQVVPIYTQHKVCYCLVIFSFFFSHLSPDIYMYSIEKPYKTDFSLTASPNNMLCPKQSFECFGFFFYLIVSKITLFFLSCDT